MPGRRLLSTFGLAVPIAAVVVLTLWPFDFDLHPESVRAKWGRFEWVFFYHRAGTVTVDRDLLFNLLLLAPLGVAIAIVRRARPVWRVALDAAAACFALSTCVELAQVLTPNRVSQLADVWRNTLGGLVAALVTWLLCRLVRALMPRTSRPAT